MPRAAKVSRVKNVERLGFGSSLIVQIEGDAARTWKKNDVVRLRSSFATPRLRNPDGTVDARAARLLDFGYVVTDISADKVTLFSTDVGPTSLEDLAVLYAPILTRRATRRPSSTPRCSRISTRRESEGLLSLTRAGRGKSSSYRE